MATLLALYLILWPVIFVAMCRDATPDIRTHVLVGASFIASTLIVSVLLGGWLIIRWVCY